MNTRSKNYVKLPGKFDIFVVKARKNHSPARSAMYHFVRDSLGLNMNDPFDRLWWDYFIKTPWFNATIVENMYKTINEFRVERRDPLIRFYAALSGKTRVFVVPIEKDLNKLRNFLINRFLIQDNEEILYYEMNEESFQKLIDKIKAERNEKLFLIKEPKIIQPLKDAGFVEGKDFFDHYDFFMWKPITSNDSYKLKEPYMLIKSM